MLVAVSPAEAKEFVSSRHYTKSASPGTFRFGWAVGGELAGVSIFDNGNHSTRTGVFGVEHASHVFHHHRLALDEGLPKGAASQFMGACLRGLRVNQPDVWAIVTYADACQGHSGVIYQATNAVYTGVVARGNLKFRKPDGELVSTQSVRGTWPERRSYAASQGWTEVRCLGKHRYVYLLGAPSHRKARPGLLWPAVPYPRTVG